MNTSPSQARVTATSATRHFTLGPALALATLLIAPHAFAANDEDQALADFVEIAILAEKQSTKLRATCEAFIVAHPDSAANEFVLFTLGKHQETTKQHGDAIATLTKFTERYPESLLITEAVMQRGEAYRLTEQAEPSIADFELAYAGFHAAGNEQAAHAMFHVVQAHKALGDETAAKATFELLQQNYPDASYTKNAANLVNVAAAKPAAAPQPTGPQVDQQAPDITFTQLDNQAQKKLSEFKGKVVVIDFWASWCGPCQAPMAKMQTYREKHPEWGDKVELIALSIDNTAAAASEHLAKNGWDKTYNAWAGDGGFRSPAATAYGIRGIPTCYIIDAKGNVAVTGHPAGLDIPVLVTELLDKP